MTPITLKFYQRAALDTLAAFARAARIRGAARGFAALADGLARQLDEVLA